MKRAHVEVAARARYMDGPVDPDGERQFIGAALFPESFQDIPVAGDVRVLSAGKGRQEFHVQVTLDTSSLEWVPVDEKKATGELQVSALLDDHRGNRKALFGSMYTVTVSRDAPPARLIAQEVVPMEVERLSSMVVVVRDNVAERVGAWEAEIQPTPAVGRVERKQVRVSSPIFMQADPDSYLLTPAGEPLLGRQLGARVFLPVEQPDARPGLHLAMVRVDNLPAGGTVRFCLDPETGSDCVQAALQSVTAPPISTSPRRRRRKSGAGP